MRLSLIICTYMRPQPIITLLKSVENQVRQPDNVIIVDGSRNDASKNAISEYQESSTLEILYYLVDDENRGLTKQRNYGISKVDDTMDVIAFLDDDTVLDPNYFLEVEKSYQNNPDVVGVGGYITNEVKWKEYQGEELSRKDYMYDGWVRKEDMRNALRKLLGLHTNYPPCYMPPFSNGRSVSSLPPTGKEYPVEYFMGGVASYKKELFEKIKFSHYFDGYGLYEDLDFTYRASLLGKLLVNTSARLEHYHDPDGRPNQYNYGKMVIRNGWYVWRLKYPKPSFEGKVKWNLIALLLTSVRFLNVLTTSKKKATFTEALGRVVGWWSLVFNKPKIQE